MLRLVRQRLVNMRHSQHGSRLKRTERNGNKTDQSVMAGSDTVPTAPERWNNKFEEVNWRNIFAKCHKSTSDAQLKWYQVRLLHSSNGIRSGCYTAQMVSGPAVTQIIPS